MRVISEVSSAPDTVSRSRVRWNGLDKSDSAQRSLEGFCDHGNEHSFFIKDVEFV